MRRRTLAVAGALATVVLAGGSAAAMTGMDDAGETAHVAIQFAGFDGPQADIVTGDTVHWTNDSVRIHSVVADDASFDSGRLPAGAMFARRFDQAGTVTYYCSLHPFMRGEIDVHDVLLDAPATHAGADKPYVLTGRVAAGITGPVTIEGDSGAGFTAAGTAAVQDDGGFRATVTPSTTTAYRAVVAGATSPAVQVVALDHTVTVKATRRGTATTLAVHVEPASTGQRVVLQLRLRDRFGWWPVRSARLDAQSNATITVRPASRVPARVLLTLPDGATELARSRTVHVGSPG